MIVHGNVVLRAHANPSPSLLRARGSDPASSASRAAAGEAEGEGRAGTRGGAGLGGAAPDCWACWSSLCCSMALTGGGAAGGAKAGGRCAWASRSPSVPR